MKMVDMLRSTLLNGYFANGTLLTGLRWPITFLVGMGLKYSCKSILDKSHRCALAPLVNNIFGSIFFFFFYTALSWTSPSLPLPTCEAGGVRAPLPPSIRGRLAPDLGGLAEFSALSLKLGPGNFLTFPFPIPDESKFMADFLMLRLTILSFSTPPTDPTF